MKTQFTLFNVLTFVILSFSACQKNNALDPVECPSCNEQSKNLIGEWQYVNTSADVVASDSTVSHFVQTIIKEQLSVNKSTNNSGDEVTAAALTLVCAPNGGYTVTQQGEYPYWNFFTTSYGSYSVQNNNLTLAAIAGDGTAQNAYATYEINNGMLTITYDETQNIQTYWSEMITEATHVKSPVVTKALRIEHFSRKAIPAFTQADSIVGKWKFVSRTSDVSTNDPASTETIDASVLFSIACPYSDSDSEENVADTITNFTLHKAGDFTLSRASLGASYSESGTYTLYQGLFAFNDRFDGKTIVMNKDTLEFHWDVKPQYTKDVLNDIGVQNNGPLVIDKIDIVDKYIKQ